MPKKAHTEEQIVAVLRQVEARARVDEVCRKVGIGQAPDRNGLQVRRGSKSKSNIINETVMERFRE
jgi:hypothetical protein